uniref:Uncharacterized protein n=2 Tax=unclassified Caudoviricetes TaxID=2788787 RepID=A0A8S5VFE7_9CAUD|nr:MAG TPA: hypothetical protein [Siphoviridae sp. ctu1o13]DAG05469.1 MAG TPA: hypothetical protein [Siphoviridae sp. ct1da40]
MRLISASVSSFCFGVRIRYSAAAACTCASILRPHFRYSSLCSTTGV